MNLSSFYNLNACPYPKCAASHFGPGAVPAHFASFGFYFRKSDCKKIQRFKCSSCQKTFSRASFAQEFRQKKRQLNSKVELLLTKGNSQRACASILNLSRNTIARKVQFVGWRAQKELAEYRTKLKQKTQNEPEFVFDEMESFIHSKLKPVSIPLLVHRKSRYILDIDVCFMPAKGKLAQASVKKYKKLPNHRRVCAKRVLTRAREVFAKESVIYSDKNPHYPGWFKAFLFPSIRHKSTKGSRAAVTGQGEMKKTEYDLLFALNHTAAMLRDNLKTLSRKTWCTAKKINRLRLLLYLYAVQHNRRLEEKEQKILLKKTKINPI